MRSWREGVPQEVQDLFDALYTLSVDAAEHLLTENHEFLPFGFRAQGDVADMISADPDEGEHPPSQDVLDLLYDGFRHERASCDAFAFVSDVRLQDGRDAIQVELEHKDGHALGILVPYRHRRLRRGITRDEMSVSTRPPRIWV